MLLGTDVEVNKKLMHIMQVSKHETRREVLFEMFCKILITENDLCFYAKIMCALIYNTCILTNLIS